jgi:hypothetical protein
MRLLLMALVALQANVLSSAAEEIEANVMIKNAIMDADEVLILDSFSNDLTRLTGYQSVTPKGRTLMAELFAKADFRGLGNPDGTQDPTGGGGFNTDRSLILCIYKNKRLTHQMTIVAGDYIYLVVPKDAWYETSFTSVPKENSPVGVNASSIEDIIRRDVKKLASEGEWKVTLSWAGEADEIDPQIEKFMPGIVTPPAPKPAP